MPPNLRDDSHRPETHWCEFLRGGGSGKGGKEGEGGEEERRYVIMNYIRTDIRSLCYSEADSGKISLRQMLSAASTPAEAANHE